MARTRKADSFLSRNINAVHLFVGATLVLPGYLFQGNLMVRILQVILFAWLARVNGKRLKWMYFTIMVVSITFFHTLNPFGEVLLELGPYTLARGALRDGLMRGFTIIGLVFISLFSIRPDLKLPGRLGGLLGRVFWYFERIFGSKRKIRVSELIESIDEVLESLYPPETAGLAAYGDTELENAQRGGAEAGAGDGQGSVKGVESQTRSTFTGMLFLALLLLINWALVFVEIPFDLL
ncbi:MAG: hypothetical protein ACOCZ9_01870 [Spirochaetota bacterium]